MRKTAGLLALLIIFPILSAIITPQAEAQNYPTYSKDLTLLSPCNQTYSTDENITLQVASKNLDYHLYGAHYSLDGKNYSLAFKQNQSDLTNPQYSAYGMFVGSANLPALPAGTHKLTVHLQIVHPAGDLIDEVSVYFTVTDKTPPKLTLNLASNATYNQTSIQLNFTLDEPASWIGYSLDNTGNVTISGNTTLTPQSGYHSIVVYANDTAGNMGQSEVASFTVQDENSKPQTMDTFVSLVVIFAVVIIASGIVFLATRRHLKPVAT